jgi:hypothetical protein
VNMATNAGACKNRDGIVQMHNKDLVISTGKIVAEGELHAHYTCINLGALSSYVGFF